MKSMSFLLSSLMLLNTQHIYANTTQCIKIYKGISKDKIAKIVDIDYANTLDLEYLKSQNQLSMVKDLSPVMNQNNWGFCHLYSFFAELVREYKQRNNSQDPQISIHYMAFHHWLNRAIKTALNPEAPLKPQEGGWYIYDIDLFKEIGVMKEDEFLRLGGQKVPEERLVKFLEDQIIQKNMVEYHRDQKLLSDVFKTSFSDKEIAALSSPNERGNFSPESILKIVKRRHIQKFFSGENNDQLSEFKEFVAKKENEFKKGTSTLTKEQIQFLNDLSFGKVVFNEKHPQILEKIQQNLRSDIKNDLTRLFANFFFESKNEVKKINGVPSEVMDKAANVRLAKEMFPEIEQKTVSISIDDSNPRLNVGVRREAKDDLVKKHVYLTASRDEVYEIIAEQVEKHNNGVWIGYDHDNSFVDNKRGIMSIKAFEWLPESPYLSRKKRFVQEQIIAGGHAVQIVGIIRAKPTVNNKVGKITGFVIQNSWGIDAGQKGFYVMDISYANANMFGITIRDESPDKKYTELNEQAKKASDLEKESLQKKQGVPAVSGFSVYIENEKKIIDEIKKSRESKN